MIKFLNLFVKLVIQCYDQVCQPVCQTFSSNVMIKLPNLFVKLVIQCYDQFSQS